MVASEVLMVAKQKQSNQVLRCPDVKLGPELPPGSQILPKGREWKPIILKWYDEFRSSPNAMLCRTDPMWMGVILAFAQLDEMLVSGRYATLGPVVRQLFDQYGWTPMSLRALKFDVPEANDHAAAPEGGTGKVINMEEWRRKLNAAM